MVKYKGGIGRKRGVLFNFSLDIVISTEGLVYFKIHTHKHFKKRAEAVLFASEKYIIILLNI